MKAVFSTCGTSILTNIADDEEKKLINKYSNFNENEIPEQDKNRIAAFLVKAKGVMEAPTRNEAKKYSAEINGIITYLEKAPYMNGDILWLIVTDTWLGGETGNICKDWLKKQQYSVQIYKQKDLQTEDYDSFRCGLAGLARWMKENIEPMRDSYSIVFNLSGGYKSINAFIQTLSTFYADDIFYIFEKSTELMHIPVLPIKWDAPEILRTKLPEYRMLRLMLPVNPTISTLDWFQVDGQKALSEWGELLWNEYIDKELYKEKIWPSPDEEIVKYGADFIKSCDEADPDRKRELNKKIDSLIKYVKFNENPNSLDLKPLTGNPVPGSTHECDAWHDGAAKRIFLHFENKVLVVDRLGKHLR